MRLVTLSAIILLAVSACGPTAEEKAKMEQARQDSIRAAEDMRKAAEELAAQAAHNDTIAADTVLPADTVR
jgi:hypothetical protein